MGFIGILLLAFGLAMDSSAVSACEGLAMPKYNAKLAATIALSYGGAEGLMSFLGWLLGTQFYNLISSFDHWVVFILLSIVGGKMIWDAFHEDPADQAKASSEHFSPQEIILLSIVTSVDALAAGVSFAFIKINVPVAVITITAVSAGCSFGATLIGHFISAKFGRVAEVAGGVILFLIGLYVLLHDLGVIAF
jgi:putative Mn2+ efflux pump MntP